MKLPQGGLPKSSSGMKDADWGKANVFEMRAQRYSHKMKSFDKGGKVKKTGVAMLHKGEEVLNRKQTKKYDKKKKTGSKR